MGAVAFAPGHGAAASPDPCGSHAGDDPRVRLFFIADVHTNHDVLDGFIEAANRERPDLVLDGGDMVHDGTWPALQRAFEDRERLDPPWFVAKGNHDARRRGSFPTDPPDLPEFQAFTCGGVRFLLVDNHEQRLEGGQFARLEEELESHPDKPTVVVMHVPPMLVRETLLVRTRHFIPLDFAEPTMEDPAEVERFVDLMARHDVLAVLTGHAHVHNDFTVAGVRYVAAGTAGGLLPGLGVQREYLDVEIDGRDMEVQRVQLLPPTRNPVTLVYRSYRFFTMVNGFNHDELGWNYTPSTSVQWRLGGRYTEGRGDRRGSNAAVTAAVSFEGVIGIPGRTSVFANAAVSGAPREVLGHFVSGYKVRPFGDFNRNAYATAGGTLNAGMLRGSGTIGAGLYAELGVEWRWFTGAVRREWATNHQALSVMIGRRH